MIIFDDDYDVGMIEKKEKKGRAKKILHYSMAFPVILLNILTHKHILI